MLSWLLPKYTEIPAISGNQLIRLLQKDGWIIAGQRRHGVALRKDIGSHVLVTIIPASSSSLPVGTLQDILGSKQTRLGKAGLLALLNKYGI